MNCRLCDADSVELAIDFGMQPIVHHLLKTPDENPTLYPFKLGNCSACGFLQLIDYIKPEILYKNYFTVSGWKNQPHVPRLLDQIHEIYHLQMKSKILEIGCNDGSFLNELRVRGHTNLIGIEPSLDAFTIAQSRHLNVIHGFFNSQLTKAKFLPAPKFDLIIARQVLEHIGDLNDFMHSATELLTDDGGLLIEVPDHNSNFEYLDYALWEEHVNYFTLNTLRSLLDRFGFRIIHHETTLFSGKTLIVFATKNRTRKKLVKNFDRDQVENYCTAWPKFRQNIWRHLETIKMNTYVYGCGARSSTIINFLEVKDLIDCYIDDQPEKQGLYVPGSALKICAYSDVDIENAYVLLGVNTENEHKVIAKRKLVEGADKLASLLPPSKMLPAIWTDLAQV